MNNLRKIGLKSEKKAAKKVNAKIVKGSGSLWYEKGDYETENFVFQNKFCKNSYQLTINNIKKAKKDALTKNKDFIFSIEFRGIFYYLFERVLINEDLEKSLNLLPLKINKSLKLTEKNINNNYLINEEFIFIDEDNFLNLKFI